MPFDHRDTARPCSPVGQGIGRSPVQVEISPEPPTAEDEVEFVENLDELVSTEVMLGCGEDNPY